MILSYIHDIVCSCYFTTIQCQHNAFLGHIQNRPPCILVDSGSSNTFLSASLAASLEGGSLRATPLKVTVADGNHMLCQTKFKELESSIQQYTFTSVAKVLPLSQYDLIIGMDWLTAHSPMEIDWRYKWMSITYKDSQVILQGQLDSLPTSSVLQVEAVSISSTDDSSPSLPPAVTTLLSEFQDVFAPPTGYPPARHCDHEIPLLVGAAPVQIRPYRYPPAAKSEIERQV